MPRIRTGALALALLALSAAAAFAAPGITIADVNLRNGPGTNFQSLGVIPSGTPVEVSRCDSGWCAVRYGPQSGFVNAAFLDFSTAPRIYRAPPPPYPYPYYGPRPGYWGPYWGPRWRYWGW